VKLTIDPQTHVYRVDGRPVASVTSIIRDAGIGPDYDGVRPDILERAKARGIHIDLARDFLDQNDLDWDTVHPPWKGYIEAWASRRRSMVCGLGPTLFIPDFPDDRLGA
jgi:hypothetical protein